MNSIDFSHSGGFPLETDTLDFLQQSFTNPIKELVKLGGDNYIINGIVDDGAKTTDGWVVIKGEIMPFKGDFKQSNITIVKTVKTADFENGAEREVYFTNYATFGAGLDAIPFASLARMSNLQQQQKRTDDLQTSHDAHKAHVVKRTGELQTAHEEHKEHVVKRTGELQAAHEEHKEQVTKRTGELQTAHEAHKVHVTTKINELKTTHNNLERRVTELEKSPFIRGMIMAWKGSIYSIPYGWQLCRALADKFIIGAGGDFGVGSTGGAREHRLTVAEMPSHCHKQGSEALYNYYGGGGRVDGHSGNRDWSTSTEGYPAYSKQDTSDTGGNQPHNNMPPYYALAYIEYVG